MRRLKSGGVDVRQYPACEFEDVPDGQWYTAYTQWAYEQNLVVGTGDGSFSPDDLITRQEMAVIFYKYAENKGIDMRPCPTAPSKHFPTAGRPTVGP